MKKYAVELSEKRGALPSVERKLKQDYGGDSLVESLYRFLKEYFKEIKEVAIESGRVVIEATAETVNEIAEKIRNVLCQRCTTGVEVNVSPI